MRGCGERTGNARGKSLVTLASEVYVIVAVGELVCALDVGEMMQHGLLHRELPEKTVAVLSPMHEPFSCCLRAL